MPISAIIITTLVCYFLGNHNGAICVSHMLGDDVREHGSGNAGLTNFMRKFSPAKGAWVLVIDFVKTILACLIGRFLLRSEGLAMEGLMLGALAVSLGHDFPALLGFRGGKGIVCGFAVALASDWRCALLILAIFVICLGITRYVSLSSVLAAAAFSVSFSLLHRHTPFVAVMGALIGLLAIFMHRGNIKRLLAGTEKKATFSQFKKKKK